ncbi:MAG: lipopolysaccharide biosynthesis protein [Lachnospiraceae bacterium]|jgi:O-antigen/teichoic acid export membrane protein|nr:lipopolysaccharide biosynthesis protein [Lachnospiraceae bacterium]
MAESFNRKNIFSGFVWRFAERSGAQGVAFLVSIVLARILVPEDYGTIALIGVFTAILNVFVDCGLGNALIQKRDADDCDFSSVFYFNLFMCSVLYIVMFFFAPYIAVFYNKPELVLIIRVLSLTLIISGLKNVQQAYVSRNMMFRRFFFATLGGTVGAAFVGIMMALYGFGVWALVIQQLFNVTVDAIILWFTVKWRPKKVFSLERLKGLFSFGWKLLVSSVLDTFYRELRQLIIGKKYSSQDLAYYNQGQKIPNLVVMNINTSIDSVLLPAMSNVQDDVVKVGSMTRRAIKISTYIMAPCMMGIAFLAPSLVRLILTDKWLSCVPFLRIFCITYMFYPVHTANLNAIRALGRSDIFLKLEIQKKAVDLVLLLSSMWFGVMAMAYSLLISSVLCQLINSWPNKSLLHYGYLQQIKDILPAISIAIVMGSMVWCISLFHLPDVIQVLIQVPVGVAIYILLSKLFHIEAYEYLKNILRQRIGKLKEQKNA